MSARSISVLPPAWAILGILVLGAAPCPAEVVTYTVKDGDTLWKIAKRYQTVIPFIRQLNGLKDDTIAANQELKIYRGPIKIVVDKSECKLRIYGEENLLGEFTVAVGREDKTPAGEFTVKTKLVNPEWTHPDTKEVIKYGDPRHEIGTRWLGIGGGLGIHGTNEPDSVGKPVSRGCIRMRNEDVESVFWAIPRGTVVVIQE